MLSVCSSDAYFSRAGGTAYQNGPIFQSSAARVGRNAYTWRCMCRIIRPWFGAIGTHGSIAVVERADPDTPVRGVARNTRAHSARGDAVTNAFNGRLAQ